MGIPLGTAELLLEEHRRRSFSGRILQLGRSSVYLTCEQLTAAARRRGLRLAQLDELGRSHDARLAAQGCLDDRSFFRLLHFEQVESCDIADWEGADHLLDLNQPLPASLHGKYDAVFDGGTLIQLFHLPNALANIHALLRPGGRVLHAVLPSSNHVDLGFFMISPTLICDFYQHNGYQLDTLYLCTFTSWWLAGRFHTSRWRLYPYRPGALDHLSQGRFGGRQLTIFAVATKLPEATGDRIPPLGRNRRGWQQFAATPGAVAGDLDHLWSSRLAPLGDRLDGLALAYPSLLPALVWVKRAAESVRRCLPAALPPPAGRL